LEFLHYGFGSQSFNVNPFGGGVLRSQIKLAVDTIKVGLNFKYF